MTWKPTEGQTRANLVLNEFQLDARRYEQRPDSALMAARLFELISKAIDQAMTDGAEQAALDKVIGNGHDPLIQASHYEDALSQLSGLETYTPPQGIWPLVPATADPVGFVMPLPDRAQLKQEGATIVAPWADPALVEAPKKRGRPKGSKGKAPKAKKAKAPKAAKVSSEQMLAEIAEERAPVLEALANGSADPIPAEAPPA